MHLIYIAMSLVGFSAITIQVLLLRELINVFSGNELIYGLTLAIWLVLTSLGSLIATKFTDKINNKISLFISTQLILALSIPLTIYLIRYIRIILGIPVGIILGLNTTLLITFIVFALPCLIIGIQFTLGTKILRERTEESPKQIGNMYILESIGSVIGGIIFSFMLIYFFNAFQIAGIIGVLLAASSLSLYKHFIRKYAKKPLKAGSIMAFALILAVCIIIIYPSGKKIDLETSKIFWQNYDLVESIDSIYGRISAIKSNDYYSFFKNGKLSFSAATPAINEELVHLSFLQHPDPEKILIIGGGFGGILDEAVKYNKPIDYLEFDQKVFDLSKKYLNIDHLVKNEQLKIHIIDGRYFINKTKAKYDLIIVNLGDPEDAIINRFFTREFFSRCKHILNSNGVLALYLSTSEGFMNQELKLLNSSVYKTLKDSFPNVIIVPSSRNYFFASREIFLTDKANPLIKRWFKKNIKTDYFSAYSIPYVVSPFKINLIKNQIQYDKFTKLNKDTSPISYFHSTLLWFSHFSSPFKNWLTNFSKISMPIFILSIILFLGTVKLLTLKLKKLNLYIIPLAMLLIGFVGMAAELLIIYTFQSFYGNIYSIIGFLLALFMAGLAIGSYLVNINSNKVKLDTLNKLAFSLILSLGIILAYMILVPGMQSILTFHLSKFVFPLFIILISLHVGAYFPAAAKLFNAQNNNLTNTAGIIYGFDLLGGALASLISSILLIPLFGLVNVLIILITIGIGSLALTLKI